MDITLKLGIVAMDVSIRVKSCHRVVCAVDFGSNPSFIRTNQSFSIFGRFLKMGVFLFFM